MISYLGTSAEKNNRRRIGNVRQREEETGANVWRGTRLQNLVPFISCFLPDFINKDQFCLLKYYDYGIICSAAAFVSATYFRCRAAAPHNLQSQVFIPLRFYSINFMDRQRHLQSMRIIAVISYNFVRYYCMPLEYVPNRLNGAK